MFSSFRWAAMPLGLSGSLAKILQTIKDLIILYQATGLSDDKEYIFFSVFKTADLSIINYK